MSLTMLVKITLSGRAPNKPLNVLIIYPANSGADMLFLLLKPLISITAPILSNKTHKLSIEFFQFVWSKKKTNSSIVNLLIIFSTSKYLYS